jgi:hypothetical protein
MHLVPVFAWIAASPALLLAFDWAFQFQIKLTYGAVTDGRRPTKYRMSFSIISFALVGSALAIAARMSDSNHSSQLAVGAVLCGVLYIALTAHFAIKSMQGTRS